MPTSAGQLRIRLLRMMPRWCSGVQLPSSQIDGGPLPPPPKDSPSRMPPVWWRSQITRLRSKMPSREFPLRKAA